MSLWGLVMVVGTTLAATSLASGGELTSGRETKDTLMKTRVASKEIVSDDLNKLMRKNQCKYEGCQDVGGICIKNKKKCDGTVLPNGCKGKKCKCCLPVYCEEPWVRIDDYCYYISYFTNETNNWDNARDFCRYNGVPNSDLVVFDRKCEDYKDLFTYLTDNGVPSTYFHIGASDRDLENTWRWVNGQLVDMTAQYWGYGEPVQHDPEFNHACLFDQDDGSGYQRWKMGDCDGTDGYFICHSIGGVFIAG